MMEKLPGEISKGKTLEKDEWIIDLCGYGLVEKGKALIEVWV